MNKRRKSIAIALACAMLVGTIATTVAIPGSDVPFGITVSAAEIVDSGSCGENLTYTIDNEGTLTISGTGEMYNYEYGCSPFSSLNDSDIRKIIIQDGVTSIGDNAFCWCTSLTSAIIPDSVTNIGQFAFYHCKSLTSITIPESVMSIGEQALGYYYNENSCEDEKSLFFTIKGYPGTEAERYAIDNGIKFLLVGEPEIIDSGSCGENVNYTLDIEGTLVISGTGDMYNYENDERPFYGFSEIEKVIIEDGVTSIGGFAFGGFTSLTSITIPDSVTSIGESAFADCTSLTDITIPDSVTSIGECAFADCTSLTSINIPDGVTSIGDSAFDECSSLVDITIPDSVTSIGDSAFRECTSLQSISIPHSVISIGVSAFSHCCSLQSITIPDSVTSIGVDAFEFCTSLSEIKVDDNNTAYSSQDGVLFDKNKETVICCPCGNTRTEYIIPDSVTSIDDGAFEDCTALTSITIPDSVTSIGNGAFYGTAWYNNQPDGMVYAGRVAYSYKGEMPENTEIKLKDGTIGIASGAFGYCQSLKSIDIPDSVTSIGNGAFWDCTSLTDITIPDGVTSIEAYAFCGCRSLKSVDIPDSVTSIEEDAFRDCDSIKSITIPKGVSTIGIYALGYSWDYNNLIKLPDFTITGYPGTEAERYAKDNEIEFIALSDDLLLGDITGDGSVDIADSLFVARADAGLATLTDAQKQAADVNGDGSADIADALLIARVDAGLARL